MIGALYFKRYVLFVSTPFDDTRERRLTGQDTKQTPLQHPQPRRLPSPLASVSKQLLRPVDPLDAFVSQWLQSVGSSERTRNCRSDSSLGHLRDEDVQPALEPNLSRSKRARSAPPDMERKDKDNQGFAVPQTPASMSGSDARGRSATAHTASSTTTSRSRSGGPRVEDPLYRWNLLHNNISMQRNGFPLPDHVASTVEYVRTKQRDSPERTDEELMNDGDRWSMFDEPRGEDQVAGYYKEHVFPTAKDPDGILQMRTSTPMARQVVPFVSGAPVSFCVPAPDIAYGYKRSNAFTDPKHQTLLGNMLHEVAANNDSGVRDTLLYPFFIVEFKANNGNMWVASNQCLGGTSACVNIAESLNRRLFEASQTKDGIVTTDTIDSSAFSVAMNGQDARIYVSWKQDELNYYMTNVDSYALSRPDEYRRFRRMVRNIVDWGRNDRLKAIQKGMDQLLEAAEKRTPDVPAPPGVPGASGAPGPSGQSARQRSPPSPSDKGSSSGRNKKHRR